MNQEFKPLPEQVSGKMIAAIEAGKSIFQKPLNDAHTAQFSVPFNPTTGNQYKGPAALVLLMQNRQDPRWMSSNQASFNKTHVLKGAKGTLINFFTNSVTRPVIENGEQVFKENGKPKTERVKLEKPELRDAWLFNGEQLHEMPKWELTPQQMSPAQRAQQIIDASKAVFEHDSMWNYYDVDSDKILIMDKEKFASPELYYAEALHQMMHWTGHETRLNHETDSTQGRDMSPKEALRTNIASILVSAELGLPYRLLEHTKYLNDWVQLMKENPNELFKAAADAQRMADHVLNFGRQTELQQGTETASALTDKLMKGDIIPYRETEYKVLGELKNKVFQMLDTGTNSKFKLSSKDNLYTSLLEAKNHTQEKVLDRNLEPEQTEEQEAELATERNNDYSPSR